MIWDGRGETSPPPPTVSIKNIRIFEQRQDKVGSIGQFFNRDDFPRIPVPD